MSCINGTGNLSSLSGSKSIPYCYPAAVQNSDGSYSVGAPSGEPFILPDVEITNSDGTVIDTVPSVKDYVAPDATIKNSEATTIISAPSGVDSELPDISIVDTFGDIIPWPSAKNYTCEQVVRTYTYAQPTGLVTSYRTGDDYHVRQNIFNNLPSGKTPRLADWHNLTEANTFGSLKRFTGSTGGYYDEINNTFHSLDGTPAFEADAFPDNYVIDHFTGFGWYKIVQTAASWNDAVDTAWNSILNGYSDWFLPNVNQMLSRRNNNSLVSLRYRPFTLGVEPALWTSTTQGASSTFAVILNTSLRVDALAKTTTIAFELCRKHF